VKARNQKVAPYSDLPILPESADTSIACLPKGVLLKHIILKLVMDDIDAAINLSFVCKKLLFLLEQPLANRLSQLLQEADQTRPDAIAKLFTALNLASRKPFLMFTRPQNMPGKTDENICPLTYATASGDLFTVREFLKISRQQGLLQEWLDTASMPVVAKHAEAAYSAETMEAYRTLELPDETFLPLYNAYKLTALAFLKCDEEFLKTGDVDVLIRNDHAAMLMTATLIGLEQAKFPLWIKQEFFRAFISWKEEVEFSELQPVKAWIADDIKVNEYQNKQTWGVDFAVYRGEDSEPHITTQRLVELTPHLDMATFATLYVSRRKRLQALIATVQEELKTSPKP